VNAVSPPNSSSSTVRKGLTSDAAAVLMGTGTLSSVGSSTSSNPIASRRAALKWERVSPAQPSPTRDRNAATMLVPIERRPRTLARTLDSSAKSAYFAGWIMCRRNERSTRPMPLGSRWLKRASTSSGVTAPRRGRHVRSSSRRSLLLKESLRWSNISFASRLASLARSRSAHSRIMETQ